MKVKACPKCGRHFEVHCFHSNNEVSTVEMEVTDAMKLLDMEIRAHRQELERLLFDQENYKRMVN